MPRRSTCFVPRVTKILELEISDEDGEPVSLRWKLVDEPSPIRKIHMEGELWSVEGVDGPPRAAIVEDSSDGSARLVFAGPGGLRLISRQGERREPYLLLALDVTVA